MREKEHMATASQSVFGSMLEALASDMDIESSALMLSFTESETLSSKFDEESEVPLLRELSSVPAALLPPLAFTRKRSDLNRDMDSVIELWITSWATCIVEL
jgi:hypothetical protein